MLAERVRAGALPPVEERLPSSPFVVRPGLLVDSRFTEMVRGTYGGTLQMSQESPSFDPHIFIGNIEPLIWANSAFDYDKGLQGNVVSDFEVSADARTFTFGLRPGLRWSDGVPVSMDDVRFAFDDVLLNEEITPIFPAYLRAGREAGGPPAKLTIVDETTFRLEFARPYGAFLSQIAIAAWISYADVLKPRHYLEQFHKKYAPAGKLAAMMEEESVPEGQWFNLFNAKQVLGSIGKMTTEQGIGHPMLTAWVLEEADAGVFRYARNPYYFKVDPDGNQLPYIDRLRSQTIQDKATSTARALMGEFDYAGERASLRQLPLIAAQERKAAIRMHIARMHRLPISFSLNLTYDDKAWRKVVRDVRFRRALSLAINREQIRQNFYLGQFASLPEEVNPATHDVEAARRLLDEMGLDGKDDEGFRIGPDGKRFRIPFEIQDLSEDHIPMAELIAEYWNAVGVHTTVRPVDGAVMGPRQVTNDFQATAIWAHHDIWPSAGWDDYLPQTYFGTLWHDWYTSAGERGEEPIQEIKDLYAAHARFMAAKLGSPESDEALKAILASHRDNVWTFVPVEHSYYPTFWSERVKNVPEGVKDGAFGIVCNMTMEQWYIDDR